VVTRPAYEGWLHLYVGGWYSWNKNSLSGMQRKTGSSHPVWSNTRSEKNRCQFIAGHPAAIAAITS